jgi:hypothetical protein
VAESKEKRAKSRESRGLRKIIQTQVNHGFLGKQRTPSFKPPYPDERAESREERAESGSRKEKGESRK